MSSALRGSASWAVWPVLALVLSLPFTAAARGPDGPARPGADDASGQGETATQLFSRAYMLWNQGKKDAACKLFERSLAQHATAGSLLNVGRCHEHRGERASAWRRYRQAADVATQTGQARRARAAQKLVRSLEGTLSSLVLEIDGDIPELEVTIDGVAVPGDELAGAYPVDPGTRRVVAEAVGYERWSKDVIVPADPPGRIRVVVTLTPGPSETPAPIQSAPTAAVQPAPSGAAPTKPGSSSATSPSGAPPPDRPGEGSTAVLTAGWVVGGVGVVGIGVGAVLGALAIDAESEVSELCPEQRCNLATAEGQQGDALLATAEDRALGSSILFGVGAACLVAGVTLIVVGQGDSDEPEEQARSSWTLQIAPVATGAMLSGRF